MTGILSSFGAKLRVLAGLDAGASAEIGGPKMKSRYVVECFDKNGNLKWAEDVENLVTNVGLNDLLTNYLKGSSYTAAFYVGLKGTGTALAADTMSSHGSWTENVNYSNSTRAALTLGSVASQSVDNSASKAVFTINGSTTMYGAFVTTGSAKSGTTGILYGVADFSVARAVESGDTLNVTITLTASAS